MAQILLDTVNFSTVPVTYTQAHNLNTDDANWLNVAATFNPAIVSTPNGGINGGVCVRTGFTWTNDQWAQVTMVVVPSQFAGVGLRFQTAAANGYFCGAQPGSASRYRIFRYDAGVLTSLNFTLRDPTAGDTINAQIEGTLITLNINSGLEIITYDTSGDATKYTTDKPAIFGSDGGAPTGNAVNAWTAGSVGTVASPTSPMFRGT